MEWLQIITDYGVTIAVIIGLGVAVVKMYQDIKALRDKNDERIEGMMDKIGDLTDGVNNNTLAITKLLDKMESRGEL